MEKNFMEALGINDPRRDYLNDELHNCIRLAKDLIYIAEVIVPGALKDLLTVILSGDSEHLTVIQNKIKSKEELVNEAFSKLILAANNINIEFDLGLFNNSTTINREIRRLISTKQGQAIIDEFNMHF